MSDTKKLLELTRTLIATMGENDLSEAEWRMGEYRLTLKRGTATAPSAAVPATAAPVDASAPASVEAPAPAPAIAAPAPSGEAPIAVTSPVYGVFYAAAEPGLPPLVTVGQSVAEGEAVCLVEAMKTFSTIPAPVAGTVVEIGPSNGEEIAAGEALVWIKPDATHGGAA
ncbi:acetyl-CoA carboxylase biotin carboxyl carrier protein [Pseudooceanicola nanhaiensis]|uniref:acetyl-CoA carboxylase biotin carboxyl carrier protein n=1 Tax=Pseudooceanicola nanhaiensis TaxID=375761 RepID=UPI001CD19CF1|nr:biotin/lipoyl-containing protein [Pseudooceanicola nanhaiensis]MCA0919970.1 acetyl-CoA carboxylase, biotin carboxyl carrier protein [Pseudooceanicola nanhaiensis]